MQLTYVSDFTCPWCAIGLAALTQALERWPGPGRPELAFAPFELNPDLGPEGVDASDYLRRKYGLDAAQLAAARDQIRERARALGLHFAERRRVWNTFDAHRLAHGAALSGRALALQQRLLGDYHERGLNPSDPGVLRAAARSAGLAADEADAVIDTRAHAEAVREGQRQVAALGIQAVPTLLVNGRVVAQGAQPPDVLAALLQRVEAAA